ncbi:hypothetical protein ANCDUO_04502 [Ancylostoma duodenale]|uniref:Helitron helicase-like domain-containing protein n=1 Tax=Ancylostoma duodenale TaxID=51022 RepID=A0A0C2DR25_9BILA|nr:hypothetical protein ANCDUO_04502 [Ancylostoma duodenale]
MTLNAIQLVIICHFQEENSDGMQEWKSMAQDRKLPNLTQREYYAYLLFPRSRSNPMLYAFKSMPQSGVDGWAGTEQNRFKFIRQNQAQLRLDASRGLQDFIMVDLSDYVSGQNNVLTATYSGGPCDTVARMRCLCAARSGKPDPVYYDLQSRMENCDLQSRMKKKNPRGAISGIDGF